MPRYLQQLTRLQLQCLLMLVNHSSPAVTCICHTMTSWHSCPRKFTQSQNAHLLRSTFSYKEHLSSLWAVQLFMLHIFLVLGFFLWPKVVFEIYPIIIIVLLRQHEWLQNIFSIALITLLLLISVIKVGATYAQSCILCIYSHIFRTLTPHTDSGITPVPPIHYNILHLNPIMSKLTFIAQEAIHDSITSSSLSSYWIALCFFHSTLTGRQIPHVLFPYSPSCKNSLKSSSISRQLKLLFISHWLVIPSPTAFTLHIPTSYSTP